jgi:hypothetical protein
MTETQKLARIEFEPTTGDGWTSPEDALLHDEESAHAHH